jgi:hypothetical protein
VTSHAVPDLVAYQSGYRWHGHDGRRLDEWPAAWVVVADQAGDPFVADTGVAGARVGVALHGTGSWRPYWVAPTLADFLTLLACFVRAYVVERLSQPGGEDEDDETWPPAYHERFGLLLRQHAPAVDATAFLEYLSR